MRYDVLVVGAGPAGSSAAHQAAVCGLSVLVLDRAEFPRDKPCGGGVTIKAGRLLPFDLSPVVERSMYGLSVSLRCRHRFTCTSPEPLAYLTQRRRLDAFMLEQAVKAGVTLQEGVPVTALERRNNGVAVKAGSQWVEGRCLIAADGANGTVSRLTGLGRPRLVGVALEGNVTPSGGVSREWETVAGLELGSVPGGYGWLFPKGDHVNIGVGGYLSPGRQLRQHLHRVARFYGFNPGDLREVRGHYLPMRLPSTPLVDRNVLLAGDAGGFLDPFTGEGIYAAIWSGQVAARHVAAFLNCESPDLSGYTQEVNEWLEPQIRVGHQFHNLFHRTPGLYLQIIRRFPPIWRGISKSIRGDREYVGLKRALPLRLGLGIDVLSRLLRGGYTRQTS